MADNTTLNSGTGGDTIASDDIGGIKHQRVKLSVGADGSASDAVPVSAGLDTTGAAIQAVGLVAQLDDSATAAVTENQFAPVRLSTRRALLVEGVASGAAVIVDGSAVTQPVSNAGLTELAAAINGSSQMDCNIATAIPAGNNNIGDVDVASVIPGTGATNLGKAIDTATGATDTGVLALATRDDALSALTPVETDNVQLRVDANGALWTHDDVLEAALAGSEIQVDIVGALPAGTNAIGKLSANSGVDIGDVDVTSMPGVVGTVADDGTTPGAPVMAGGWAKNFDGTDPGNVSAEDDVTRFVSDRNRRQYVNTVHPQFWSYHLDTSTAQTDTEVKAAPGANLANFVTDIVFSSGSATAINLFFEESTTKILGPYYLEAVAGRGMAVHFTTPKKITTNTAFTLTTSASIAHCVDVMGFTARVD